jgi:hypothetical protein
VEISDATLREILAVRAAPKPGSVKGTGIPRPKELADDSGVDSTLRAAILDSYTAALYDRSPSSWSESEIADIRSQVDAVLKGSGF